MTSALLLEITDLKTAYEHVMNPSIFSYIEQNIAYDLDTYTISPPSYYCLAFAAYTHSHIVNI